MTWLAVVVTLLLLALFFCGVPVAFSLAIAGVFGLLVIGGPTVTLGALGNTFLSSTDSYELITIPMFLLMAEFVILSGIASSLFRAAAIWVGRVPGGLGIATTIAGAAFAAISGSSTASAATLSATSIPEMLKQGYEPKMTCGVVAISGTLAVLIPPSIGLILYAIIADVSVGKMLIAGVIPGLLVAFTIALTVYILVLLDPSRAPPGKRYTMREKFASLTITGPMLALFFAVTGVIYTGIATPTEAAGLGAFGSFLLALKAGAISPRSLLEALTKATGATCMIFTIIVSAHVFGVLLTMTQVTQQIVAAVNSSALEPWMVLVILIAILLIMGAVMDQIAILILAVPVMLPVIVAIGYDPVWFGVLFVVIAEVGLLTPPVGLNVFVVSIFANRPTSEVFAGIWPHVYAHLLLIALMVIFPSIILWLPATMK